MSTSTAPAVISNPSLPAGSRVYVNKTPQESAFGGWIGSVKETHRHDDGPIMIVVAFDHPEYGKFETSFMPGELRLR